MDAMLVAMEKWVLKILKPTLTKFQNNYGLENEEAMNFVKALIGKYMDFFAGKQRFSTFGTDEYANDATSAQGWYSPQMVSTLWQVC